MSTRPSQATIDNFINDGLGVFASDLITREEASSCLRSGDLFYQAAMCCDSKLFTTTMVSRVLSEMSHLICIRSRKNATDRPRLWVLRDREKYEAMSDTQLYNEYLRQRQDIKPKIEAVK